MACEARIRKMGEEAPEAVRAIMQDYRHALRAEERELLARITEQLKEHPLWDWCERVKGLGPVACMTFLGFIDPYKADTAGKAKAYVGAVPGKKLKSGERLRMNPEAKGRTWLVTRNVIMAKDDYYYPLYAEKKRYYMETERKVFMDGEWVTWPPFKEIIEDPKRCPRYEECLRRLTGKARRLKRKVKKLPCKLHVDQMSKRFLMGLLVSHACELMRRAEGLPVDNFKAHRGYIAPK
jgi:hypothetical protein